MHIVCKLYFVRLKVVI